MIVGPTICVATLKNPTVTWNLACSWAKIRACFAVRPRPPYSTGQVSPAQSAYFQAYQMQPDNPDYAYNLAIGLEHLSQPKLALTYYRKALELSFQKGPANFDQNRVIERIGQLSARVD